MFRIVKMGTFKEAGGKKCPPKFTKFTEMFHIFKIYIFM